MFLPSDTPAANRSLIYVITCHNTHTESRFLFTPPRRLQPPSRTHGFYLANHYRPGSCALCCPPLRRSQPLSYLRSHLSTPTRRVSVSLRADARPLSRPPLRRSHSLSYLCYHLSQHTLNLGFSSHRRADSRYLPGRTTFTQKTLSHADPCALFRSPLCRSQLLSYRHAHLSTPTRRVSVSLHADARFSARRCTGCNPLFHRFLVASKKNETFFENLRTFFPF